MKIPITKYGLPQVVIYPGLLVIGMGVLLFLMKPTPLFFLIEGVLTLLLIWSLSFFRDPERTVPLDESVFLSPADGKVKDITLLEKDSPLGVPAIRISIFLSIFNVHINRVPCAVQIQRIEYRKGAFKNAQSPESGQVNESNDVYMERITDPHSPLLVRQISGAIARRIVCTAKPGERLKQGERFGMIKFGSRTELYIPQTPELSVEVKVGNPVKAGLTPLARYR
ncbi:MAG TPA: phosphatidylserine decarboxylase [Spirochaetales bacterium]|nr:phosphatidylserine decarboxylase [Spirochaetales bacterium]